MFSKPTTPSAAPSPVASSPIAQPKRAASSRSGAPSIISADLTVTGTLSSEGDIQIDGIVEGDVHSAGLVVGEKAQIHGELLADEIVVRGRVVGRIRARKVQLAATAHVEGDILHEAFAVESGAFFEGNCRHSDNPLGEQAKKPALQQAAPVQRTAPVATGSGYSTSTVSQPAE